ncbi:MAG: hypothetical protein NTW85_10300 [Methylococcales bacterium]|nr:hypothetical protein [Methylococcales bacterium]
MHDTVIDLLINKVVVGAIFIHNYRFNPLPYNRLAEWGFQHKTVNHSAHEYARDEDGDGFCEVRSNSIEGFWSLLRPWL